MQNDCISMNRLVLYLAGKLPDVQRNEINIHLNNCTTCRQRLLSACDEDAESAVPPPNWLVSQVARMPVDRKKSRFFKGSVRMSMAAIAAIVVIGLGISLIVFERIPLLQQPEGIFRNAPSHAVNAPELFDPRVQKETIEFRWSKIPGTQNYLLTILDDTGNVVFKTSINSDSFVLHRADASFVTGKPYFWFVTATDSRAVSTDSNIEKFFPDQPLP